MTARPDSPADHPSSRAELVATGSELLTGRTINTHASALARGLAPLGLKLVRETTVPDDEASIAGALAGALERVDLVFVTGGLGPTSDDITREAVARHAGRGMLMDEPSRERIRQMCVRTGREFSESRQRQAQVVEGAVALPNSVGAAPGERIELGARTVFLLPGPPDEFEAVLNEHVLPWLREQRARDIPAERILMTSGIAESEIIAQVEAEHLPPAGVEIAYCAAPGRVEVRLTDVSAGGAAVDEAAAKLRQSLGRHVFAEERATLAEVVGRLLTEKRHTLATAESCTGGLLGQLITSVSGSSAYYVGGVIAYANDVKLRELGVHRDTLARHGAVSAATASEMAAGVRARYEAHYGIGVTGIAGPAGGTADKPVGLVYICVADTGRSWVQEHRFSGGRARIREWAAQAALNMLRLRILGMG